MGYLMRGLEGLVYGRMTAAWPSVWQTLYSITKECSFLNIYATCSYCGSSMVWTTVAGSIRSVLVETLRFPCKNLCTSLTIIV
jgi:hypothetical protein